MKALGARLLVVMSLALAVASWAVSHPVMFEIRGMVTDARVTSDFGSWDDLGIAVGDPWLGYWSYDANALGVVPPGYYTNAGFELEVSIEDNTFRTLGTPRYLRITPDAGGATSSLYHAFDDFHGGLIYTPWDEAPTARSRTSADYFSLELSDVVLGPLGPGGLPTDMSFSNPNVAPDRLHLHGTLGLDSFSFDLEVSTIRFVPEPSALGLIVLGATALIIRRCRSLR